MTAPISRGNVVHGVIHSAMGKVCYYSLNDAWKLTSQFSCHTSRPLTTLTSSSTCKRKLSHLRVDIQYSDWQWWLLMHAFMCAVGFFDLRFLFTALSFLCLLTCRLHTDCLRNASWITAESSAWLGLFPLTFLQTCTLKKHRPTDSVDGASGI